MVLIAAAAAGCAALDEQQWRWTFQPSVRSRAGGLAAAQGMQGMQDAGIEFDPGRPKAPRSNRPSAAAPPAPAKAQLQALWLPQVNASAPVLLYPHGARWDERGSAHRMRRMHGQGLRSAERELPRIWTEHAGAAAT